MSELKKNIESEDSNDEPRVYMIKSTEKDKIFYGNDDRTNDEKIFKNFENLEFIENKNFEYNSKLKMKKKSLNSSFNIENMEDSSNYVVDDIIIKHSSKTPRKLDVSDTSLNSIDSSVNSTSNNSKENSFVKITDKLLNRGIQTDLNPADKSLLFLSHPSSLNTSRIVTSDSDKTNKEKKT